MRVWVSRAAHYKRTMAGPERAEGTEGAEEGWLVSMKRGELDLDSS